LAEPTNSSDLRGRIPELDGMRGVAIGTVLVFHYFQVPHVTQHGSVASVVLFPFRLGWSGVDLFFVLSGFLIGGILLDARDATNYFRVFYTRRFFRIVPIYAVILLLFPVLSAFANHASSKPFEWLYDSPMPWYSYWTFTQNFWMAHSGVFGANALGVSWSLAVEEQFYLTLPLLVRVLSRRALVAVVAFGALFAPLLRTAIFNHNPNHAIAAYVLMPCRADALLLGVLAAILLRDPVWKERIARARRFFYLEFALLLAGLLYFAWKSSYLGSRLAVTTGYSWLALFYASVLLYALTQPSSLLARALRISWLRWLGSIAYGAYLIHDVALGLAYAYGWNSSPIINSMPTLLTALAALAFTIGVAWLSWRYFEGPLVRHGHRARYKFSPRAPEGVTPAEAGAAYS
jgi:peptidoglycan/LPS O-acetylase OafA/YrhL